MKGNRGRRRKAGDFLSLSLFHFYFRQTRTQRPSQLGFNQTGHKKGTPRIRQIELHRVGPKRELNSSSSTFVGHLEKMQRWNRSTLSLSRPLILFGDDIYERINCYVLPFFFFPGIN